MTSLKISNRFSRNFQFSVIFGLVCAVVLALFVTSIPSPVKAAGGTGTWGDWTATKPNGTLNLNVGGFTSPSASFTTNANGLSVSSGASTWLNDGTGPGAMYGTSRGSGYLSMGTATGGADSTTTFTFNNTTPTSGWSFVLGDIDADAVTISATDANDNAVNVGAWTVTPFNYCNNTSPRPTSCAGVSSDAPTWNAGTATVTGNGNDTDGASAWVRPNSALKTLTLKFKKLTGFPTYQLWFAGDTVADQNYKVTLVARICPTYTDIMANKARNNIMESLQNVGINSLYSNAPYAGPVRPEVEDAPASLQAACVPFLGWTFGMGQGTNGKDTGAFGSLSKVKSPYQSATTLESIPELDSFGNDTGRTIQGAITFNLTPAQISGLANKTSWVQGGIPGAPLNQNSMVAFGTLRCAIDNANADNIEWLGTSGGARHMFCYAYYVDTAEKSGTIIVRKVVPKGGAGISFGFGGDLSFTPGGKFNLSAGGSQSFIRAAGETWNVTEDPAVDPFVLTGLSCNSGNGLSTISTNLATGAASVTLGIADTVTCTFTNESKPKANLSVYKVANGALGTFGFDLSQGGTSIYSGDTSVTELGVEKLVTTKNALGPGSYTITETSLPSTPGGTWDAPTVSCVDSTGAEVATSGSVATGASLTLAGVDVNCIVVNNFTPNAKIKIVNKIVGGSGVISADAGFTTINSLTRSENSDTLTNVAWGDGGAKDAEQTGLGFGDYEITGAAPINTDTGTWELDSLDCSGGASHAISDSTVSLTLDSSSNAATEITCTYVWRITKLANVTIKKTSVGEVGTFTLTAEIAGDLNEGEVTTAAVNTPTEALSLLTIPEGTAITLGESAILDPADGKWNVDTSGDPTWACTDSAGNDVALDADNKFTSTDLDITCVATNTFTLDPTPEPTDSPDPDPTDSPDPEATAIAYTKGGELPDTGGAPTSSLWVRVCNSVFGLFHW